MLPQPTSMQLVRRTQPVPWRLAYFASGRLALAHLLLAQAPRSTILIPTYHCKVIRDACHWANCDVVCYPVNDRLDPVQDAVLDLIERLKPSSVLLVHYFGAICRQDWLALACLRNGITLIHDCAHLDVQHPGTIPEIQNLRGWIISSPRKYYPIYDGGICFNTEGGPIDGPTVQTLHELRALKWQTSMFRVRTAGKERAVDGDRDRPLTGALPANRARGEKRRRAGPYDSFAAPPRMSLCSQFVMRHDNARLLHRRRTMNHLELCRLINSQCKRIQLYRPEVDQAYCVTALIDDPDLHYELRERGIQAWRWEDAPAEACATARFFEKHLVQIPCHQGIGAGGLKELRRILSDY